MLVLALDTTTRAGSAAVVVDGEVRVERAGDPALTHGQRLPGELQRLVRDSGVSLENVDLLAVAAGPGSFTGLRVGIAAVQGLAMALDRRVVPVSALDALARAAAPTGTAEASGPVAVWMDAQRGEVFAALYDPTGAAPLIEPTALTPGDTLSWWRDRLPTGAIRFIGDGAVRYEAFVRGSGIGGSIEAPPPLAGIIGRLAWANPGRAVLPHAIVPIYVRRPDAEIARNRRAVPR